MSSEENNDKEFKGKEIVIPKEKLNQVNTKEENNEFAGLSDKEILKKLNLPNPETMKTGDNFKEFLKKNVPEHLKKRALRKLWLTNPIFANLDGMNEYDEDFTLATSALEEFATNYVVGKGFKGQFKKDTDISESDFLEKDDTLKSSSVRLNEKNKELTSSQKSNVNKDEINEDHNFENSSEQIKDSQIENDEDNDKDKDVLAQNENNDNLDNNLASDDLSEENVNLRIKPKKMIFKV
jgi:hypothetical protein